MSSSPSLSHGSGGEHGDSGSDGSGGGRPRGSRGHGRRHRSRSSSPSGSDGHGPRRHSHSHRRRGHRSNRHDDSDDGSADGSGGDGGGHDGRRHHHHHRHHRHSRHHSGGSHGERRGRHDDRHHHEHRDDRRRQDEHPRRHDGDDAGGKEDRHRGVDHPAPPPAPSAAVPSSSSTSVRGDGRMDWMMRPPTSRSAAAVAPGGGGDGAHAAVLPPIPTPGLTVDAAAPAAMDTPTLPSTTPSTSSWRDKIAAKMAAASAAAPTQPPPPPATVASLPPPLPDSTVGSRGGGSTEAGGWRKAVASAPAPAPVAPAPAHPPPPPAAPATPEELNRLHAAAMRASIMGDTTRHAAIMAQIAAAKPASTMPASGGGGGGGGGSTLPPPSSAPLDPWEARAIRLGLPGAGAATTSRHGGGGDDVHVVAPLDARGVPIPSLMDGKDAPLEREDLRAGRRGGKKGGHTNWLERDADGHVHRMGFLPEDKEEMSLAELVRQERASGREADMDRVLARNIMGGGKRGAARYTGAAWGSDSRGGDEDDMGAMDDMAAAATDRSSRLTGRERQRRDMAVAVAADQAWGAATSSCAYCFDNPSMRKQLVVAMGDHAMVMLPPGGAQIPGQCVLVPLAHIAAVTDAGEEVYDEINRFKAALHAMYSAEGEDVLFLETCLVSGGGIGGRRHAHIDVIPMDKEVAFDAPLFFRKAILEAEEWTTNKVLVDTAGKGLRACIPRGFPYFHVSWRGGGFVHPIDDVDTFPASFGIDICAGMLGLPPGSWDRKGKGLGSRHRDEAMEAAAVASMRAKWAPHSWFNASSVASGSGTGGR